MSTRTLIACAAGAGIVISSPLIGDLRGALLRAFPRYYVLIISTAVVVAALGLASATGVAALGRAPRRFGYVLGAAALAIVSFGLLRTGNPNVDAVEAFHLVEYGVLTLQFFPFGQPGPRGDAYLLAALASTVVAVADEWFQWFVPRRAGEWHDVIFDLLATASGLLLCRALDVRQGGLKTALYARRGIAIGAFAAVAIALLGGFLATIHVGHEIRDPDIGVFRSRFSDDRLRELGAERLREWGGGPPPIVGEYGREDQYEAEALWHVRRRNLGMDPDRKGDPNELDVAWHENLILERHFKAVLDAASAGGATGHRLAPAQIADLDARRAHASVPFVSDAEAMPIYVWSPVVFWTIIGGAAAAALIAGLQLDRARVRRT